MANREEGSLLGGRSQIPLDDAQVRSVASTFLGLDREVPFRHDPAGPTRFILEKDENTQEDVGVVLYGPDVYPGPSVLDPNSALTMRAAVAHEICHFHRRSARTELPLNVHTPLDEALTSLDAVLRFQSELSAHEIQQLVRDAVQRLAMHAQEIAVESPEGA